MQLWIQCCQLLLLLCTLYYPLLRQAPPPEDWKPIGASYCSNTEGSVPLIEDAQMGFGLTRAECKQKCLEDSECKMFSFGTWQKGVSAKMSLGLGGHYGETRCQLYAQCAMKSLPKMSVYMKPAPQATSSSLDRADLVSLVQMLANVLLLFNAKLAWLSIAVSACQFLLIAYGIQGAGGSTHSGLAALHAANLLVLSALEWGNRKLKALQANHEEDASSTSSAVISHSSEEAARLKDHVPTWRQDECQAPAWLLLPMVLLAAAELIGMLRIWNIPICKSRTSASEFGLTRLWNLLGSTEETCAQQRLVAWTLSVTTAWCCGVLLIVFLTNQRDAITLLTSCVGVCSLALQACLAFLHPEQAATASFTIPIHCLTLVLLWTSRASSQSRTEDVMEAENKRDPRERELIDLLISQVRSRCHGIVDTSRWMAMVDICMSSLVLSAAVCFVAKGGQDIVNGESVIFNIVGKVTGINLSSALRYSFVTMAVAVLAPLLAHFFLRLRDGLQQLYASSSDCRAKAMQHLAIETAEWIAARESEVIEWSRASGSDLIAVNDWRQAQRPGDQEDELVHRDSTTSCTPLTEPRFHAWVESQAKDLLKFRLTDQWQLDENFISEAEARSKFLAGDLSRAVNETAERAFGATMYPSKVSTRGTSWRRWLFFAVACAVLYAAAVASRSRSEALIPPGIANPQVNATCSQAAMRWGGALAVGSAIVFAVPGVGPVGLAAIELAGAAGIGAGAGITNLISCYTGT